jgi:tetratricopeptide (TPR) repeat protein
MRRAIGDRRGESITLGNLGNLLLYQGAYAQARGHYKQALRIQQEIGARNDEALSVGNLSLVYHYLGEDGTALEYSRQALQIAQETGELRTEGAMWMKLGHALAGLGSLDEAARAYQKSVSLRRQMGWTDVAMEPLAGLSRVALARGDLAQAQAHASQILDHLESGTLNGTIAPLEILLTCYRALDAARDPRARQVLDMAYGRLQDSAERVGDEGMKRSFLEVVPYHREIVQAFMRARESG